MAPRRQKFNAALSGPTAEETSARAPTDSSNIITTSDRPHHGNIDAHVESIESQLGSKDGPVAQVLVPSGQKASSTDNVKALGEQVAEVTTDDVCFICTEKVKYWSGGICGHKTCQ